MSGTSLRYHLAARFIAMLLLLCLGIMHVEAALHVHARHVPMCEQLDAAHDDEASAECELCKATVVPAVGPHTLDVAYAPGVAHVTESYRPFHILQGPDQPAGPPRAPPRP